MNTAKYGDGGAMFTYASNLTIDRSQFTLNSMRSGYNGGAAIYSSGRLLVSSTMFANNKPLRSY